MVILLTKKFLCYLGSLGNLQTLKLDENHLAELPSSIGRLVIIWFLSLLQLHLLFLYFFSLLVCLLSWQVHIHSQCNQRGLLKKRFCFIHIVDFLVNLRFFMVLVYLFLLALFTFFVCFVYPENIHTHYSLKVSVNEISGE